MEDEIQLFCPMNVKYPNDQESIRNNIELPIQLQK